MKFLNYELPTALIAQRPVEFGSGRREDRGKARLLVTSLANGGEVEIQDSVFDSLPDFLQSGDLLVLNNTRVIASRFFGVNTRNGKEVEVVLLQNKEGLVWEALAKPLRRLQEGDALRLGKGLEVDVVGRSENGSSMLVKVREEIEEEDFEKWLIDCGGQMPIPPYIRSGRSDQVDIEQYQTIYAKVPGSVAAPTAGLHFTEGVFRVLEEKGVEKVFISLHVGRASFVPIREGEIEAHQMDLESCEISAVVAKKILRAKAEGKRVVAVGTTTVRALESWALRGNEMGVENYIFETGLFIKPGFEFKVVDAMITNFHQPNSTHLLLVGAFFGEENIAKIYQHAIGNKYRFLSYGDAMLLDFKSKSLSPIPPHPRPSLSPSPSPNSR